MPPLILAIDYGQAKVGLAIGSLAPATPLHVIHYSHSEQLIGQLIQVINSERPDQILWGWPADTLNHRTPITDKIQKLAVQLSQATNLPAAFYPEVLTTQQAIRQMISSGVSPKRRRQQEDSYAAAAILDQYLQDQEP